MNTKPVQKEQVKISLPKKVLEKLRTQAAPLGKPLATYIADIVLNHVFDSPKQTKSTKGPYVSVADQKAQQAADHAAEKAEVVPGLNAVRKPFLEIAKHYELITTSVSTFPDCIAFRQDNNDSDPQAAQSMSIHTFLRNYFRYTFGPEDGAPDACYRVLTAIWYGKEWSAFVDSGREMRFWEDMDPLPAYPTRDERAAFEADCIEVWKYLNMRATQTERTWVPKTFPRLYK